jgi:hypothetical protein
LFFGKGKFLKKTPENAQSGEARKRRRIEIGQKEENIEEYWAVTLPELPEVDDNEIGEAEIQKYTVPALLAQLRDIDFTRRD